MAEVMKWLAAFGAGAAATLLQYVQGASTANWWQALVVAALVRLCSWAVAKIPAGA